MVSLRKSTRRRLSLRDQAININSSVHAVVIVLSDTWNLNDWHAHKNKTSADAHKNKQRKQPYENKIEKAKKQLKITKFVLENDRKPRNCGG